MKGAGFTAAFAFASRASSQVFAVILTLVATRYLTPHDFGSFALASTVVILSRTLLYSGPYEFLLKSEDEIRWSGPCLWTTLALAMAASLVLFALSPVWSLMFGPGDPWLLPLLAGSIIPSAFPAWQEALLLRRQRINVYYAITVTVELAAMLLAIGMLADFGVLALVAQLYARAMLFMLAYAFANRSRVFTFASLPDCREVLAWSVARYGSVLAGFASNYSADIVLGIFAGPAATGIYRASSRIVTAVYDIVAQPTRMLAVTGLSRLRAGGGSLDSRWLTMFAGSAWFGIPALMGLAMVANLAIPMLLGRDWAAASPVIAILCLARIFGLAGIVPAAALVAFDRQLVLFWIQIASSAGTVLATALMASYGILAVAEAVTLVSAISSLLIVVVAARITAEPLDWRTVAIVILPPTLAVEAAGLVSSEVLPSLLPRSPLPLLAAISSGAAAWVVVVVILRKRIYQALQSLTQAH